MGRKDNGDCFEVGVNYIMDHQFNGTNTSLKLVHGIVSGQGSLLGTRFPHCWVERGDVVIEKSNGLDLEIPIQPYYRVGNIQESQVRRYDYKEMSAKMSDEGTYGPWDLPKPEYEEAVPTIIIWESVNHAD